MRLGVLSAGPCGGLEADRLVASGFGEIVSRSNEATWLSATAGLLGIARLSRWVAIRAALDATVLLSRAVRGRGRGNGVPHCRRIPAYVDGARVPDSLRSR